MLVKELIELLESYPQDAKVLIGLEDSEYITELEVDENPRLSELSEDEDDEELDDEKEDDYIVLTPTEYL